MVPFGYRILQHSQRKAITLLKDDRNLMKATKTVADAMPDDHCVGAIGGNSQIGVNSSGAGGVA